MQIKKSLRPTNFREFIGQTKLLKTLKVMIFSAKTRKVMCDHILFYGKAGMGKTSLALLFAKKLGAKIKFAQGALIEKKADLLSLFSLLEKNEVIFIDEFHSINKQVEELIYSALEDFVIDIPIGIEGESKIVRMKLMPFTMIAATTKFNQISNPLKERFGYIGKFNDYTQTEIVQILINTAKKLKLVTNQASLDLIANHSGSIPRIANNLLRRCYDFAIVAKKTTIDARVVRTTFKTIGIYQFGLDDTHIKFLNILAKTFANKAVSIDVLVGILSDSKENIEINVEPLLLKNRLLKKSSRGRMITKKGIEYLQKHNFF